MGFSDELIKEIKGDYLTSDSFTPEEKAAMRWAEVMTDKLYQGAPGQPPQHKDAMAELKIYYNEGQIVELSMVSGFFNFWNRFTDSLEVDIEDNPVMNLFTRSTAIDPKDYVDFMRDCWWTEKQEWED